MGHVNGKVSVSNVRGAFRTFVGLAQREGFDTTGWELAEGNSAESWRLFRINSEGGREFNTTPFPSFLGNTAREAYNTLTAWSQFATALRNNRAATIGIEPGSQIG